MFIITFTFFLFFTFFIFYFSPLYLLFFILVLYIRSLIFLVPFGEAAVPGVAASSSFVDPCLSATFGSSNSFHGDVDSVAAPSACGNPSSQISSSLRCLTVNGTLLSLLFHASFFDILHMMAFSDNTLFTHFKILLLK